MQREAMKKSILKRCERYCAVTFAFARNSRSGCSAAGNDSSMPSKYAGEDALAYQEGPADPAGPVNYVQKRLQKRKGIEVVFDAKGHKEFLTGFHLRKQQRRKAAAKQIEKKERQTKLEERAERRKALRDKLKLDQYESDPEASTRDAGEQAEPRQTFVHEAGEYKSVVTVEPLNWNDHSEAAAREASSSDESSGMAKETNRLASSAASKKAISMPAPAQSKKLKPAAIIRKKQKHEGKNKKKKHKKKAKV